MKIVRPKKWDGKWHIIAFDIPEPKRKARNALTMKLKEIGCYPAQKSLFVSAFTCREEVDFIGGIFNIREHISYFIAVEVENERFLKGFFNLE